MSASSRRGFLAAAGGAGAAALGTGTAAGAAEIPLLSSHVAGAGRHCARAVFAGLAPGEALALRREPDNGYDARAVAVWTQRGEMLGYVPRIHNQAVANLMDAGLRPVARVAAVSPGGARPDVALDVRLALGP